MELLPTVIRYVDSLLGLSALIIAMFVLITCRTMVKEVVTELRNIAERLADESKNLHGRVSGISTQLNVGYQTRQMCESQHAHINERMDAFRSWGEKIETKLDLHQTQILTELQSHKQGVK